MEKIIYKPNYFNIINIEKYNFETYKLASFCSDLSLRELLYIAKDNNFKTIEDFITFDYKNYQNYKLTPMSWEFIGHDGKLIKGENTLTKHKFIKNISEFISLLKLTKDPKSFNKYNIIKSFNIKDLDIDLINKELKSKRGVPADKLNIALKLAISHLINDYHFAYMVALNILLYANNLEFAFGTIIKSDKEYELDFDLFKQETKKFANTIGYKNYLIDREETYDFNCRTLFHLVYNQLATKITGIKTPRY